jgi:hypothetical protein
MEMIGTGLWPSIHHTAEVVRFDQPAVRSEVDSFWMVVLGFAGLKEVVAAQRERALQICVSNYG